MIETRVWKQETGIFRGFVHIQIIDNVPLPKIILSPEEFEKFKKQINEVEQE